MAQTHKRLSDNIGNEMVEEHLISEDQLAVALETQKNLGGNLGHILLRKKFLTEEQILEFLKRRFNIPHISLVDYPIEAEAIKMVPASIARKYNIIPLAKDKDGITIAMANPLDVFVLDSIDNAIKQRVQPVFASEQEVRELIEENYRALGAGKEVTAELEPVELAGQRATALALVFSELLSNALEHGGDHVSIGLEGADGDVVLLVADDGRGIGDGVEGTGMSIVRALVRDELGGALSLVDAGGLRAEVRFPAERSAARA